MTQSVVPLKIADADQQIRHVFVRDLIVEARIGIHRHEKKATQRVRINLDLSVIDKFDGDIDNIDQVVCYEDVVKATKTIIEAGHINLVETLAERIAKKLLETAETNSVRVRVEKLDVLPDVGSVGVEIERTRK